MEHDCDISKKAGKNKSRDLTQERLWAVYVGEESSHLVDSSTQRSCCNGALKDPSILCLHAQMVIHRHPMNLAISLPCNCAKKTTAALKSHLHALKLTLMYHSLSRSNQSWTKTISCNQITQKLRFVSNKVIVLDHTRSYCVSEPSNVNHTLKHFHISKVQ